MSFNVVVLLLVNLFCLSLTGEYLTITIVIIYLIV